MKKNTVLITAMAIATLGTTTQSCEAMASTNIGLTVVKQILLNGINKGFNIFSDKDSFLANQLIESALPQQLKDINNTLQKMGLGNIVQKEKEYIAQAASFTVDVSRPILVNAVNNLTTEDAIRIVRGGSGAATQILKERTSQQLAAAIAPKVEEKLNEFGIVKTLNSALAGSNLLGTLLGGQNTSNIATGGFSRLASEQMVNGLFFIIQNHEQQNSSNIINAVNGIK